MKFNPSENNGVRYAVVESDELVITDIDSAIDIIANVKYAANTNRVIIKKENIIDDFFILKTRLAGEILQKFTQYDTKLSIVGDFSVYNSKPLNDFIYESNKGRDVSFFATIEDAIDWITK